MNGDHETPIERPAETFYRVILSGDQYDVIELALWTAHDGDISEDRLASAEAALADAEEVR